MTIATYYEACREYAENCGRERPQQAWILTPWDTWERNPFYSGPKVRHPEDDNYEEEVDQTDYDKGPNGEVWGFPKGPVRPDLATPDDDEIPF